VQFAERYPTEDEVATAIATYPSWTQAIDNLPKPKCVRLYTLGRRGVPPPRRGPCALVSAAGAALKR